MRIQQLHLLRYGKFTDQALAFPHAGRDFHLITGANEAGKSTTRNAILDLLYGIETRTAFAFQHGMPDLRLGATIEHQGSELEFFRIKARSKTLLGSDGKAIADSQLETYLAESDRDYFDQMFGLDHARLREGGDAILSASTNLGQILFQSAAGIGSLATVRDQLQAEAESIWTRRRSGERTYYVASDELELAEAALKAATVRTKEWMEARDEVHRLEEARELSRGLQRDLEATRRRLERVRRVAPALRQLRDRQTELQEQGDVVLLPQDAAKRLSEAESELVSAGRDQLLYASQAADARERLALINVDDRLLKHEAEIQSLAERSQQIRNHERDIDRRQLEVSVHWQRVETLVRQLGWSAVTEETLLQKLPALPARAVVAGLAKRFAVLDHARQTTSDAVTERAADQESLETQLKSVSVSTVPAALRAALISARGLGDVKAGLRREEASVAKSARELTSATSSLGRWSFDPVTLRGLVLPSEQEVRSHQKRQTDAHAAGKALADKQLDLATALKAQELVVTQYRNAHQPVSVGELALARGERDAVWRSIKSAEKPIHEVAADFETKVGVADAVSDRRHDKAQEVGELQSRRDALERLQLQAADNETRQLAVDADRVAADAAWSQLTASIGLIGMALQEFEPWRTARDKMLRVEEGLTDAQQALHVAQETAQTATVTLSAALREAGIAFDGAAALETLLLIAGEAVDRATAATALLDQLKKQRDAAATALSRQREKSDLAQAQFDAWSNEWRAGTAEAGLPEAFDVAAAEAALAVMTEIDDKLKGIEELRKARIESMMRDLTDFAKRVGITVTSAAPDLAEQTSTVAVTELAARLGKALEDKKEADRLRKDLKSQESLAKSASDRVERAKATLLPLLGLAGVSDHLDLPPLIARSDRRRLVEAEAAVAKRAVEEGGDGLALEALEAEVAAHDATQVPGLLSDLAAQILGVGQEQEALTAEYTHASTRLATIAGGSNAARAESERQDALAKMANAAERFIKVYTAARMLKWAIDRYRETKQGPMLTRASEIFRELTLGSFEKLTVDFEKEPLALEGQRVGGKLVPIKAMSDGTRDQLYLALRLAALELHLGKGHALPFIADDLFINYDDKRAKAGLEALASLSEKTQVIFLSHHDHLVPAVKAVFGHDVNVVAL